jgi:hypothetical protein
MALVATIAVILTFPWRRAGNATVPPERRTIVKGDASGSSFERFWVKGADSFLMVNCRASNLNEFYHASGNVYAEVDGLIVKNANTVFNLSGGSTVKARNIHYDGD